MALAGEGGGGRGTERGLRRGGGGGPRGRESHRDVHEQEPAAEVRRGLQRGTAASLPGPRPCTVRCQPPKTPDSPPVSCQPSLAPHSPCPAPRRTLADIIMEKITEKQTEVETALSEISGCPMPQLDPRVLEVYRGVREVRLEQPNSSIPLRREGTALCPCCHCPQSWLCPCL